MKLHLVTIGQPKLIYARLGWEEYVKRLDRFHQVRITHLADKYADDAAHILTAAGSAHKVVLVINAPQFSSEELAIFLNIRAAEGRELCFIIGGPNGLPPGVIASAHTQWSFSGLTFLHDLAMVILAESLYRSSTITAGHPYHRG